MKHLFFTVLVAILFTSCTKNEDNTPVLVSTLPDGLVAHYPFNGNANDTTVNANHGTVSGALLTSDRFGNSNQAYLFDGINDHIIINDSPSLNLKESFSISAWVSPDDYHNPGIVVWHGDPAYAKDPFILYFTDRPGYNSIGVRKDVGDGTTINEAFAPPNVIFSGIWSHVVGVCNAATKQMKLYINGELLKIVSVTDMSIGYSTAGLWTLIGAAQSTAGIDKFFKGKIDEIRIYNRELTQSEITEIFKL